MFRIILVLKKFAVIVNIKVTSQSNLHLKISFWVNYGWSYMVPTNKIFTME